MLKIRFQLLAFVISLILFTSCKEVNYVKTRSDFEFTKIDSSIKGDREIEEFLKPYHDNVNEKLNKVISYTKTDLWTFRAVKNSTESTMGNLIADLLFEQASEKANELNLEEFDFVVLNRNGIRTSIPVGEITIRDMFEIMPFENTLLIVTLSPEKMNSLIQYMAHSKGHPMSGITMKMKDQKPVEVKIAGKDYDPEKQYRVVTSDYLQHGGDKMYFFSNPVSIDSLNYLLRDAMTDYFVENDTVEVELDGRFSHE